MEKPLCNFCSTKFAKTKCINCNQHSCSQNIYCCQKIQKNLNETAVICNLCVIEIGHKLKPYQNKKTQFKSKKNISEIIHHLDKKIKKKEHSRIVCQNKIKTIRDSFNLINESSKFLQQFVYN